MHSDQFLLKENKLLRYFVWLVDNINKFKAALLKPIAVLIKKKKKLCVCGVGGNFFFFLWIPNLFLTVEMHDPLSAFVEQTVIFSSVHNSLLHFALQYTYFHLVYDIFFLYFQFYLIRIFNFKIDPHPRPPSKKIDRPINSYRVFKFTINWFYLLNFGEGGLQTTQYWSSGLRNCWRST